MIQRQKCRLFTELASMAMEQKITLTETARLAWHCAICEPCKQHCKNIEQLRSFLRQQDRDAS